MCIVCKNDTYTCALAYSHTHLLLCVESRHICACQSVRFNSHCDDISCIYVCVYQVLGTNELHSDWSTEMRHSDWSTEMCYSGWSMEMCHSQWSTEMLHSDWSTEMCYSEWSTEMCHSQWSMEMLHSDWSTEVHISRSHTGASSECMYVDMYVQYIHTWGFLQLMVVVINHNIYDTHTYVRTYVCLSPISSYIIMVCVVRCWFVLIGIACWHSVVAMSTIKHLSWRHFCNS